MRAFSIAASAFILGVTGTVATAVPVFPPHGLPIDGRLQPVASWRYHDNCAWRDGRYIVDLGIGRVVLCRPTRPGRDWNWRNDGRRQGWYDRRRNVWHENNNR
jgi:hypothetical protein